MFQHASAEMKNDMTQLTYFGTVRLLVLLNLAQARVHFVYKIAFTSWNASLC